MEKVVEIKIDEITLDNKHALDTDDEIIKGWVTIQIGMSRVTVNAKEFIKLIQVFEE